MIKFELIWDIVEMDEHSLNVFRTMIDQWCFARLRSIWFSAAQHVVDCQLFESFGVKISNSKW